MVKIEKDRKKMREFLNLVDNSHYDFHKFSRPILVFEMKEKTVQYTLWEEDLFEQLGIDNVVGYDYEEDSLYVPDWALDYDEFDDDDFDDDDDDDLIADLIQDDDEDL